MSKSSKEDKIKELTNEDYLKTAKDLARRVTNCNFDVVVGIADRGIEIAEIVARELGVSLLKISARRHAFYEGHMRDIREFDDDSHHPNLTDILIGKFMDKGKNETEAIEKFKEYWKNEIEPSITIRIIEIDKLECIKDKSVLIVDEAAFTGNTIREVKKYLEKYKPRSIHTLVILCGNSRLHPDVIDYAYLLG